MDQGKEQQKREHVLYTQTLKHLQTKSQRHSAKKQTKTKKYNKACITIPTEDNTDKEKMLLKEQNIGGEDFKLYQNIKN